jgi:hypothetical protein
LASLMGFLLGGHCTKNKSGEHPLT